MKNIFRGILAALLIAVAPLTMAAPAQAAGGYATVIYGIAYPWTYNAAGAVLGSSATPTHSDVITVTASGSTTTCGGFTSSYCGTVPLVGAAQFSTPASVTCGVSWSEAGEPTAGYIGAYQLLSAGGGTLAAVSWSSTGPVTAIYFGSSSSSIANNVVTIQCSGY